jgi:pimeloyl-ACP methyl ester carboxylesterase
VASGGEIAIRDGRTLTFEEWGDPQGTPVLCLHGTPGSRFNRHHDQGVYAKAGARVVTYDRPGYGGSTRHRGRDVVGCVDDIAALVDALGIERFAVIGYSGGGPHALAAAARLPERVTRAACDVGVAPYDADGLDFFDGMDPLNVQELGWALEGEEVYAREIEREARELLERVSENPANVLGEDWELPEADRAELARPELHDVIRESMTEAFRNGVWGWVDDGLCFVRSWGFDLSEIRVPTRVVYGASDVLVPAAHGEWLARNVPGAEVVVQETQGHVAGDDVVAEQFGWLVRQ